jgi:hypothetical protein
MPFSVL